MRTPSALLVTVLIAVTVLCACSPLTLLNAMVPERGYERTPDIAYATLERQKLDVYVPLAANTDGAKPVIVFFYGGGWASGSRVDYRFVAEALTSQGFIVVIPDYRLYPEARFPDFVVDAAKALRWTKDNIARFGGDPRQLFLMGHSAGAHIAAMLTLDRQYLNAVDMAPAQLCGTIGLAGPYDFLSLRSEKLKTIFGPEPERWRSQPINHVDGRNPPMLLITGLSDGVVNPGETQRLAAKISAHGGAVRVIEYPDLGHYRIIVRLASPFRGDEELLQSVAQFVRERASDIHADVAPARRLHQ